MSVARRVPLLLFRKASDTGSRDYVARLLPGVDRILLVILEEVYVSSPNIRAWLFRVVRRSIGIPIPPPSAHVQTAGGE